MKKIAFTFIFVFLTTFSANAVSIEDTQILDELDKTNTKELNIDFKLQQFTSCDNFEDVMGNYIKKYWEANKDKYRNMPYIGYDEVLTNSIDSDLQVNEEISEDISGGLDGLDYSETNVQVSGVDESDIIKTDGKYIYYYNENDKYVYIVKSYPATELDIVKKIKIPDNFYSPVLYLSNNRLVILASGYSSSDYRDYYWIDRNSKTYTIIYDISDIESPKLLKLNVSDGALTKSRKIGDYVYVLSNNYFSIPYYNFGSEDDISIEIQKMLPKSLEIYKTNDENKQNLQLNGESYPYNVKSGNVANCSEIEYLLPDDDTLSKYDFSPSYNIISVFNINNTDSETKTKVIAGSNSEIYMSLDNLYLTTSMYQSYDFHCPINAYCMMPYYYRGENTLIHKINVDKQNLTYNNSTIIPGRPLTQYSMDEKDGYFRIITSKWHPQRQTDLYVLDKDLKLAGSLKGLGKGEDFKSSRFMGDKLFLVTFEQIDPLFVIDLADQTKPEVIGELKMPGYSTYLHPYDENHLIGIGYDTTQNQWGGTINNGLKIDLYEVDYTKSGKKYIGYGEECDLIDVSQDCDYFSDDIGCGCRGGSYSGIYVEQKYSLTLGEYGSTSEALTNPRMFMWNSNKKTLFLPATIYKNDKDDLYKHIDYFNGLVALNIDADSGIKENWRATHIDMSKIENDRQEECKTYSVGSEDCVKIIGGGDYCAPKGSRYVPEYCYEDSPIGEYLSNKYWNYYNQYVKRALWIGDSVYSVSDTMIGASNMSDGEELGNIKFK